MVCDMYIRARLGNTNWLHNPTIFTPFHREILLRRTRLKLLKIFNDFLYKFMGHQKYVIVFNRRNSVSFEYLVKCCFFVAENKMKERSEKKNKLDSSQLFICCSKHLTFVVSRKFTFNVVHKSKLSASCVPYASFLC